MAVVKGIREKVHLPLYDSFEFEKEKTGIESEIKALKERLADETERHVSVSAQYERLSAEIFEISEERTTLNTRIDEERKANALDLFR